MKVDPKTRRTIPVITKPDLIDKGAETSVLHLLQGKIMDFAMGFHMVKCRGQQALNDGVTLEEAINQEEVFFRLQKPWNLEKDRTLFGVPNLTQKLAQIQIRMIEDSLTNIQKEVSFKKLQAQEDLNKVGLDLSSDHQRRDYFS